MGSELGVEKNRKKMNYRRPVGHEHEEKPLGLTPSKVMLAILFFFILYSVVF